MPTKTDYALVNGTRLYYEVTGSGVPVVLIHGWGEDRRIWDAQVEALAHHFQVLRYDLRGFGESALPTGKSYAHTDDLQALLEYVNIARAHIMGRSMGGAIAIEFALEYPTMTRSLIIVAAGLAGFPFSKEMLSSWAKLDSKAREEGLEAAKAFMPTIYYERAWDNPPVRAHLSRIVTDYSGWHLFNEDASLSLDPPAVSRLAEIRCPTLIVGGNRDLLDFQKIADMLQKHIPNAQRVVIPDVGHAVNLEAPKHFNEMVLNFLRSL